MKRSSILGALVLCALSLCAFGAANASAAGLTAVTCEEIGAGGKYNSLECATPTGAGEWETTQVPLNTGTIISSETVGTSVLKGVIAGANVEITCSNASMSLGGEITNRELGGEMSIEGTDLTTEYRGCHASLQANTVKKCQVESVSGISKILGKVYTNSLKSVSSTEHKIAFEPTAAGGAFAKFKILKGECLGATAEVTVTGSVIGIANTEKHHHVTFTPATNGGNLKANGGAASYEATHTALMFATLNPVGAETF